MGRIRSLKPEFFTSRSLARVSPLARLTFQGLWCQADDYGNGIAHSDLLKGALWPLDRDVTPELVEEHLRALEDTGHIRLYVVAGERYYSVISWEQNQSAALRRGSAKYPSADDGVPAARGDVQDARETVLLYGGEQGGEQGGGSAPKNGARTRDPLFDAVVIACALEVDALTGPARGALNRALAELRGVKATPDDVPVRAANYHAMYPQNSLTPSALAKHWPALGKPPAGMQLSKGGQAVDRVFAALGDTDAGH